VLRDAHQVGHLVWIRPVLAQRQQQRRDEVQLGSVVLHLLDLFGRQNLKKEINFHLSAIESGLSTFRVGPRLPGGRLSDAAAYDLNEGKCPGGRRAAPLRVVQKVVVEFFIQMPISAMQIVLILASVSGVSL
jgi:hypothetical protein